MSGNASEPNALYRHIVLEGTAYECGQTLGRHIRSQAGPEYGMYTRLQPWQRNLSPAEIAHFVEVNDRYFPGVTDEMRGLADGLGIELGQLASSLYWYRQQGRCSHLAALPSVTASGHVLAARSYEWSTEDALCLITTRVKGRFAHIGFSIFGCGRFDGLNEKGLCVTMSCGAPGKNYPGRPPDADGFMFWAAIRAVLDRCSCTDDAVELMMSLPSCSYDNIILSDRQGAAALLENAHGVRAVKRIGADSSGQVLYSTNHYVLPGMAEYGEAPMWMSLARSNRIGQFIEAEAPSITMESLKSLLSTPVPGGLCSHHYSDWFGTLWSMVFDVTDGKVDVCFGSPMANGWHTFGLSDPAGIACYPALLPDEPCADPKFFSKVTGQT